MAILKHRYNCPAQTTLLECGPQYGPWATLDVLVTVQPWKGWYVFIVLRDSAPDDLNCMQWPYTYDSCDVGTVPNQTLNGLPLAAVVDGDHAYNFALSYLPGQRLSRCTCNGENHPGPKHPDGTYVGRSAPEIDMFEAQMSGVPLTGEVSQSAQWAVSNSLVSCALLDFYMFCSHSMRHIHGTTRLKI